MARINDGGLDSTEGPFRSGRNYDDDILSGSDNRGAQSNGGPSRVQ